MRLADMIKALLGTVTRRLPKMQSELSLHSHRFQDSPCSLLLSMQLMTIKQIALCDGLAWEKQLLSDTYLEMMDCTS